MVTLQDVTGSLLQSPRSVSHTLQSQSLAHQVFSDTAHQTPSRASSSYKPMHTFALQKQPPYQQQFGDMYFLRLAKIRPAADEVAAAAWSDTVIAGEEAKRVERVLDVRQGELCWVTGTVYMDMPLKPSILEDVSKDVS